VAEVRRQSLVVDWVEIINSTNPINPINFYPVKYFVEISEADLTGTINLVNMEP
jgi:hypothetical protein